VACNSNKIEITNTQQSQSIEDAEITEKYIAGKIAIITDASVNDGSFQSVQMLIEKHPGRVIHEVWPDGERDDTKKLENMGAIIAKDYLYWKTQDKRTLVESHPHRVLL